MVDSDAFYDDGIWMGYGGLARSSVGASPAWREVGPETSCDVPDRVKEAKCDWVFMMTELSESDVGLSRNRQPVRREVDGKARRDASLASPPPGFIFISPVPRF